MRRLLRGDPGGHATPASGQDSLRLHLLIAIIAAATASGLLWLSSPWGIGTTNDSVQYLLGARALAEGGSLLELSRRWPPLYPTLLALLNMLAADTLVAARVLHTVLFGLNTLLFAALLRPAAATRRVAALLAVPAFALAPALYVVHYMAWSESLFFSFLLLHLLALRRWHAGGDSRVLVAAGTCLGLAMLTRYAGLAFVGATALHLLLSREPRRWCALAAFLASAALLPAAWMAWLLAHGVHDAPRELVLHPVGTQHLGEALRTIAVFCHADTFGRWPSLLLALVLVLAPLRALQTGHGNGDRALLRVLLLWPACYFLFLLVSISLFDHYTPLDTRILAPLPVFLLAALALGESSLRRGERLVPALVLAAMLAGGLPQLAALLRQHTLYGFGYLERAIARTPIMEFVRANERLPRMYSNAPELVALYFGRGSEPLPIAFDPERDRANALFPQQMAAVAEAVRRGDAALVHFAMFDARSYFPTRETLRNEYALPVLYAGSDGAVFGRAVAAPRAE